jgi:hypothetical protein
MIAVQPTHFDKYNEAARKKHTIVSLRWWSPSARGSGMGGSPLYLGHLGQIFTYLNIPHPNI